ncbi:MAG: transglutaminase-like domain-containing protein [Defluviitaleaceae bacterium]|nr:transglutaminase-like domain-containing protein [Defluviitaleaceae bacterium]
MSSKRRIEDYALYLVIGSIYAFGINLSILTTTILVVPLWQLFMVGVGLLILFMVMFWNKYTILGSIAVILICALVMFWRRESDTMIELWYFGNELIMAARGYMGFRIEFIWPMVLAICFLTALFIVVCLYVNFHFYMLSSFGAAIFIVCWIMDYPQSLLGFILYLFCFCVFLIRKLHGQNKYKTRAALIAAPFCALVVWSVTAMPVPASTLDSNAVNRFLSDPWEAIGDFFFVAFNPRYFSFQTTGFAGQGGRLGGPVTPNHRVVMAVESPRRTYLSGATHNVYTGYVWTTDTPEFVPPNGLIHPSYIEFFETAHALFRGASRMEFGPEPPDFRFFTYLPLSYVDIFVGNNRTASLFRPMRERGVRFDDPSIDETLLVNASGDRRLTELIPRNSAYRYNFLDLDYRQEHIQSILRHSRRGIYRERLENPQPLTFSLYLYRDEIPFGEVLLDRRLPLYNTYHVIVTLAPEGINHDLIIGPYVLHRSNLTTYNSHPENLIAFDQMVNSFDSLESEMELFNRFNTDSARTLLNLKTGLKSDELLADYADFVYANYLSLPDTLPQRVIDLAKDITRYYYTDYDRIRALQEYLIQFPYTLSPSRVPRDRDFVDYFLFDGQEGYCVYYASAMVVMSRAIGIPARYAEGFLLPAHRDTETGLFTVTNRNAHAWAEVYFEGFGWLIVETTAPYLYAMYERPFSAMSNIFAGDFMADDWWYYEMWQMGLWDSYDGDWERLTGVSVLTTGLNEAYNEQAVTVNVNWWQILLIVVIVIPSVLVLYFTAHTIMRLLRRLKVNAMSPDDKTIYYYREILKITEYWNYPILEEETTFVYGQRLRYRFTFVNESVYLRDLNDIYYRARYGSEPLTDEEAKLMKDCYYELVDYARTVRPGLNYMYMRYVKTVIAL